MPSKIFPAARLLLSFVLSAAVLATPAPAQDEDVVRVEAELVQTDVMVFDKQGKFVDGLRPEDFELKVDGKPQPVSFFERVVAGSVDEDAQLAAARGGRTRSTSTSPGAAPKPLDRGRVVVFFVDDLHLSPSSVKSARDTLLKFVNEQMGQNDQAVVASASGQIGFLQQLTGDKAVLRRAVSMLNYRAFNVRDMERPPMSAHQALAVERRDPHVVDFYVDALLRETPTLRRDIAENMVSMRANQIITQSNAVAVNTLATLESLVRSSAQMPGRKVAFFVSDGFFVTSRDGTLRDRMRRISDAAARSGVVIYSMDARGLTSGLHDASSDEAFDPAGRLATLHVGERNALQEPLFVLANDTGGRALVNTNALDVSLTRALKETSVYYLLAWRPEGVAPQRSAKFRRIEVSVKGRPELKVMVRRGLFDGPPPPAAEARRERGREKPNERPNANPADEAMMAAIRAVFPQNALPTAVSVGYASAPTQAAVLTATIEVDDAALEYFEQKAVADVLGAVYDAEGKPVSTFKQQLSVNAPRDAGGPRRRVSYSQQLTLPPGLYQVRVAARDARSGRVGSANEWVEIPDFSRGRLVLSSIFIGEKAAEAAPPAGAPAGATPPPVLVSGDRRFARDSRLRFLLHIYNAAPGPPGPDVALQVQVFRDDQPVVTTPLRKINTEGFTDTKRIPYAAELNLDSLPAGRYLLKVSAIDRLAKTAATQQTDFTVQ
ncbi:MAG TPA: VWA domain-containing protein [Pyrinomonadaceae bacterium]|nr:VWA domain-containing protein [Pyrinomonadaceae bacterium]